VPWRDKVCAFPRGFFIKMKVGDKVRCKYLAKGFKQATTPGLKAGGVYLLETIKIVQDHDGLDMVVGTLLGLKPKKGHPPSNFALCSFEVVPDARIRHSARAGFFQAPRPPQV
jgi:hypothetical protein